MYVPPAFRENDPQTLHKLIGDARLCNLVTSTAEGLMSSPLPLYLVPDEGELGTLYGHLAKANLQWKAAPICEAMAIFMGPDAYVSPSWYATKLEHGKVVPTWNYVAVHAYGPIEFFDDADRLLSLVSHLTDIHERTRANPWSVEDAPEQFIRAQLRGIVGVRMPLSRIEGKCKMSQNRSAADRLGVAKGLAGSHQTQDQVVAGLIPLER